MDLRGAVGYFPIFPPIHPEPLHRTTYFIDHDALNEIDPYCHRVGQPRT